MTRRVHENPCLCISGMPTRARVREIAPHHITCHTTSRHATRRTYRCLHYCASEAYRGSPRYILFRLAKTIFLSQTLSCDNREKHIVGRCMYVDERMNRSQSFECRITDRRLSSARVWLKLSNFHARFNSAHTQGCMHSPYVDNARRAVQR